MSGRAGTDLSLGSALEEVRELLASPFTTDEYRQKMLELQAATHDLLKQQTTGQSPGPPLVGEPDVGPELGPSNTFYYQGEVRRIPPVIEPEHDIKVANQRYKGPRQNRKDVTGTLAAGDTKTFAEVQVPPQMVFLAKHTNATAHNTVKYEYYVDDKSSPDDDLSGTTPWATPPGLYEVAPNGYMVVDDVIRLDISETSGNTSYSTVQGTLTGILLDL